MQRTLVQTADFEKDVAHDIITGVVPGRVSLDVLQLCKTDMVYDRNTPLATLQSGVATYTGYAAGVITWSSVTVDSAGEVELLGTVPIFRPTDAVVDNSIFGAWLENAAGTKVHAVSRLADPDAIPMNSPTTALLVTVRLRMGKLDNELEIIF